MKNPSKAMLSLLAGIFTAPFILSHHKQSHTNTIHACKYIFFYHLIIKRFLRILN
ncbi:MULTISPECIES: hypothetical protein [Helicobacter]|uniref:Uncharacterized protein n=1 Tax=Helicobacter ibis TaxID=2962633 RepID=A0ABT4VER5_9HELI|nr:MULTISPECIES: hypothetical protein [Helicobacter]MDA3967066.1 hypothetical protein [Helicobacter sp. WB40]MDA3969200.1 hypothetical protein [Helicobacter ibis]